MPRYFTQYWDNATWDRESARDEGELDHTASNLFERRRVRQGDFLYVVTVRKGKLFVAGRMQVEAILSQKEAERHLKTRNLWLASDHAVAKPGRATRMVFNRQVPPDVVQSLRFVTGDGERPPAFISSGVLDSQTMRGVRQLTATSARKLDAILAGEIAAEEHAGNAGEDHLRTDGTRDSKAENLNSDVLEAIEVARGKAQGFRASAKVRRHIEEYAMRRAMAELRNRGYGVEDVHRQLPCDLKCVKDSETLHIEVKGTQNDGTEILLTPNEVAFAREHFPAMALFILCGIHVAGDDENPIVSGGEARLLCPWKPDEDRLTPLGFSYRVG